YSGIICALSADEMPSFIWGFIIEGNNVLQCNRNNQDGTNNEGVAGITIGRLVRCATVSHNHVYGCYGRGIAIERSVSGSNSHMIQVVNNIALNNTGAGFHFHNPVNVIVSGNISGNDDS